MRESSAKSGPSLTVKFAIRPFSIVPIVSLIPSNDAGAVVKAAINCASLRPASRASRARAGNESRCFRRLVVKETGTPAAISRAAFDGATAQLSRSRSEILSDNRGEERSGG